MSKYQPRDMTLTVSPSPSDIKVGDRIRIVGIVGAPESVFIVDDVQPGRHGELVIYSSESERPLHPIRAKHQN